MKSRVLAWAISSLCFTAPAMAQSLPDDDPHWAQKLDADARAIHVVMLDSHPGSYDTLNPQFREQLDAGLALALERASRTNTKGGWWWALRDYVSGFDDGHVILSSVGNWGFPVRWPGFLTRYQGLEQRIVARSDTLANLPPLGAKLIECDGVDAETLAQERVGRYRGRWSLEAQRAAFGDWTFLSAQNPWQEEMRECRFEHDGGVQSYSLEWRDGGSELSQIRNTMVKAPPFNIGMQTLDDGGIWISASTFDSNPQGPNFEALNALVAQMEGNQNLLRSAPYVVFDVRGNGGGSSIWSLNMARALWGEDWVEGHRVPPSSGVDWRASQANVDEFKSFLSSLDEAGTTDEVRDYAVDAIRGMEAALANGEMYYRQTSSREVAEDRAPTALLPTGRILVLTDYSCASACLDAVDLWKAAGAIQIGRETSADTVYMEMRDANLPSGLATVTVPMKVYRDRYRGHNQPHTPQHRMPLETLSEEQLRSGVSAIARRQPTRP